MALRPSRFRRLLVELRRRKVYRVAAVYAVGAVAALEIVDVLVPSTSLPPWADELFLSLAIVGLPLAVVLAWVFDVTRDGIQWTDGASASSNTSVLGDDGSVEAVAAPEERGGDATAAAGLDERTVAVLPFENLSGDVEADPFAAGLHDDVLTELTRVPGLTVISRTSVKRYKQSELSITAIGRELGAGTVVEGGVQAVSGRVRLNVQLIDARTDQHRWAERFDRTLSTETIFEIQSELAERIARTLHAQLADRPDETRGPRTEDLEAYRLHARGRQHFAEYTQEGMQRALELFERATERDADYAIAWADLGTTLIHLGEYRHMDEEAAFARGESALRRALDIDPLLAEAHTAYGNLHSARRDAPRSIEYHRRAIDLRPGFAPAHKWLGWASLLVGDAETAVTAGERARVLDPADAEGGGNLAIAYLGLGRVDQGLAEARRTVSLYPDFDYPRWAEALVLLEVGQPREASERLQGMKEAWAASWPATARSLETLARGGVDQALDAARAMPDFHRGIVNAAAGHADEALERLAMSEPWPWDETLYLRYAPGPLRSFAGDSRWVELMQALDRSWGLGARPPNGPSPTLA